MYVSDGIRRPMTKQTGFQVTLRDSRHIKFDKNRTFFLLLRTATRLHPSPVEHDWLCAPLAPLCGCRVERFFVKEAVSGRYKVDIDLTRR